MATWNQHADWTGGNLYIEGTTSKREILVFSGDEVSIPPLMGRVNFDLIASTSETGVCGSIANPTTEEIWVEKVILNIDTASSSCCGLSLGIATAASSSASNMANQTLDGTAAALTLLHSSGTFPVAWNATSFCTAYAVSTGGGFGALVGDVSVFYCVAVTT